jgi:stage II sporulation protein D
LTLRDEALDDETNRVASYLAPVRYLFRRVGEATFYAPELALLPNDPVLFHLGDEGVDLLVLLSEGGSFDRSSRFSHWVVRKSSSELTKEVNARVEVGDVVDLRPKRYGRSGRVVELEIVGTRANKTVRGLAIRRALGIRENLFFLDVQRGPTGKIRGWVFTGRGWGHGVGLCQVGAYGMAAAGFGYREILSHYYPGTRLQRGAQVSTLEHVDKAHHSP